MSPGPLTDGRQSETALEIRRGTQRLLAGYGFASLPEVPLPNGRRADLMAVGRAREIWILEIKSSVADFRADQKWPEYGEFCDRLWFAVSPDFPVAILPETTGLILADRYGAEVIREAPAAKLPAARRTKLLTHLARLGAFRLQALADPDLATKLAADLESGGG